MMQVLKTNAFTKALKKLHPNQKKDLDDAVHTVMTDLTIGQGKKGDLSGVRVHKFKMVDQLTLLAYMFQDDKLILTLLAFGSHENFYRDLKKNLN